MARIEIENITEPYIYISEKQTMLIRDTNLFPAIKQMLEDEKIQLPAWLPQRVIARDLRYDLSGIEKALEHTNQKPYVWATEFENVHDRWSYDEPEITVDGTNYENSETYFHSQKPTPFNDREWKTKRDAVMMTAIKSKMISDPRLKILLLSTKNYPLLSLKGDTYWGVDPVYGGSNRLAELWMEIRTELQKDGDED